MQVTAVEVMRLKKEIGSLINITKDYLTGAARAGDVSENNEVISGQEEMSIIEVMPILDELIRLNLELNDKFDAFNQENKVPALVRKKKNHELLLNVFTQLMIKSKPASRKEYKTVHDKRVLVETKFEPLMSKKEFRQKIKDCKSEIRKIQSLIDTINTNRIELSFDYDKVAELDQIVQTKSPRYSTTLSGGAFGRGIALS